MLCINFFACSCVMEIVYLLSVFRIQPLLSFHECFQINLVLLCSKIIFIQINFFLQRKVWIKIFDLKIWVGFYVLFSFVFLLDFQNQVFIGWIIFALYEIKLLLWSIGKMFFNFDSQEFFISINSCFYFFSKFFSHYYLFDRHFMVISRVILRIRFQEM